MDHNEHIQEEEYIYPEKPKLERYETKDSIMKSLWSLFIFMITFYIVFRSWAFVVMISLVLIVHEMGHFSFMKIYNYRNLSLRFIPFLGAYVSGNKSPLSQKEQANILLAGPVPGIIFGMVLFLVAQQFQNLTILYLAKIFLLINAFNLLPIAPLDGGRLLQNFFFTSHEKLQNLFSLISIILLTGLCVYLEAYIFIIIPGLMYLRYRADQKNIHLRKKLISQGLDYRKSYEELENKEYWKIRDFIADNCPEFSDLTKKNYRITQFESLIISKIRSLLIQAPKQDLPFYLKASYIILWIVLGITPFLIFEII